MSLQRLRRVLSTSVVVQVQSAAEVVELVTAAGQQRAHLNPKPAAVYSPFAVPTVLQFRPLDFLRKIGELTTPRNLNLARLSASWATRRYFWAVPDPRNSAAPVNFKLSTDARTIERHQKTLLSDEFGMGFAGLVAERLLEASEFVDIDFAVTRPARFFGAAAAHRRRPDFLMWGDSTPLFIVECKGSQTSERGVINQMRRGLEQLPSITVDKRQSVSLVIATHLRARDTIVHVIDPRNEESKHRERRLIDDTIDSFGDNKFAVSNHERFDVKVRRGVDIFRLRWAGQHAAAERIAEMWFDTRRRQDVQDAELDRVSTDVGDFLGTSTPLVPELGLRGPQLFRGLRAAVLEDLRGEAGVPPQIARSLGEVHSEDPAFSSGRSETCLAVVGLEM
jgi:hypothetical protein